MVRDGFVSDQVLERNGQHMFVILYQGSEQMYVLVFRIIRIGLPREPSSIAELVLIIIQGVRRGVLFLILPSLTYY